MEENRAASRTPRGIMGSIVSIASLVLALFQLYTAGFGFYPNIIQRAIHVGIILFVGFLVLPRFRSESRTKTPIIDAAIAVLVLIATAYTVLSYGRIVMDPGSSTIIDNVVGVLFILTIIEGSRRALGWVFPLLVGGMLLYAIAGPYLPGIWAHRGFGPKIIIETLYMTTNGIWGQITGISATIVSIFMIFGALLLRTGGGKTFIDLSSWATQKATAGGPKMAVLASGLFGTINGNGPANVAATGTFTIPMMKQLGYRPEFSGAVEATASTGGQLAPPIMGAGAFVMAELIGVPYGKIALSATIPAIMFYLGVYISVHLFSLRDYKGIGASGRRITFKDVVGLESVAQLFIPLIALIAALCLDYTPDRAAFLACAAAVLTYMGFGRSMAGLKERSMACLKALEEGGRGLVQIGVLVASAQIVVTLISLTGVSVKLSQLLFTLTSGKVGLSLLLAMIICIFMGMGVPTVAAYILCATVCAPPLVGLGLSPLSVHLFIFYFAVMSAVTPPVCASTYVAASIAESDWWKTAWLAVLLALPGFIVPFAFVYSPGLLLEGSLIAILEAAGSCLIGIAALAVAITGYAFGKLPTHMRVIAFIGACALLEPTRIGNIVGLVALAAIVVWQLIRRSPDIVATQGADD